MKRIFFLMTLVGLIYGLTLPAYATLIDRGGGFIYDDDLNITWLQDANYAKTSEFNSTGQMNWNDAMAWASGLNYGGVSGWRLPNILNVDQSSGTAMGEMDHLFYAELKNQPNDFSGFNSGPFMNIQHGPDPGLNDEYWYATVFSDIPSQAWFFSFLSGRNDPTPMIDDFVFAWAVHDGDVAAVPEPNTLLLLASGLIGMVAFRKKFKK